MSGPAARPPLGLAPAGSTPAGLPHWIGGYAAIFDHADQGGDIIMPGAFAATLARLVRPDGSLGLPLLLQHDAARPIGLIEALAEDARGLRMRARLHAGRGRGRIAAQALAQGTLTGLSIGYRVRTAQPDEQPATAGAMGAAMRRLLALDLVEISLVQAPMQPLARVDSLIAANGTPLP